MSAIVDTLRQTLLAAPGNWQFRLALVEALVAEGRIDEAGPVVADAGEWPTDPESQIWAARAYGLLNPADGLGILEPMIQTDPTCAAAHYEKAILSWRTGDHQIAKRHYFTALTFDPSLEDPGFEAELNNSDTVLPAAPTPVIATQVIEDDPMEALAVAVEAVTPGPSPLPVQPLRAALETRSIHVRPLVHPDSIPRLPTLVHQPNTVRHQPVYTPKETWADDLHNVYVHPVTRDDRVVYDYRCPDEGLFEPAIGPDEIYVVADGSDAGRSESNSLESFLRNRRLRDLKIARERRRNKVSAVLTGILTMGALILIMWLIKLAIPVTSPPEIVATTTNRVEKTLQKKVIPIRQVNAAPTPSSSSPVSAEVITSMSVSSVAVPTFEATDAVDLELGTSFGSGLGFGSVAGSGNSGTFFGSKVSGGMAVVFDITGSMYKSNPLVVAEINRRFKTSQVVAVFGATFRDRGSSDLVPYKDNEEVLANVDTNGKKSATQLNMNKALFSLSRCDSLAAKGYEIQSLGKAVEALLNQPLNQQPKTIFIFSDFQDGVDLAYMEKVQQLVKRRRARIVFYHPVAFTKDETHYREFARETGGEVKEGLPKK